MCSSPPKHLLQNENLLWKEVIFTNSFLLCRRDIYERVAEARVIITTQHLNRGNDTLSDNLEEAARVGGGSAAGKGDQEVEDPVPSKHMEEVVEGGTVNHEQTLRHKTTH